MGRIPRSWRCRHACIVDGETMDILVMQERCSTQGIIEEINRNNEIVNKSDEKIKELWNQLSRIKGIN